MHSPERFRAVFSLVMIGALGGACSLLAPGDDELMGGTTDASSGGKGGSTGGKTGDSSTSGGTGAGGGGSGGTISQGGSAGVVSQGGNGGKISQGGSAGVVSQGGSAGTAQGGSVSGGSSGVGGSPGGGGNSGSGGTTADAGSGTCAGKCGQSLAGGQCSCDGSCTAKSNCCSDYVALCETDRVTCGSNLCALGQFCCANFVSGSYVCTNNGAGCNAVDVRCNGPEDCDAGDVCCLKLGGFQLVDILDCRPHGACDNYPDERVICRADSDCLAGETCQQSPSLQNAYACTP